MVQKVDVAVISGGVVGTEKRVNWHLTLSTIIDSGVKYQVYVDAVKQESQTFD